MTPDLEAFRKAFEEAERSLRTSVPSIAFDQPHDQKLRHYHANLRQESLKEVGKYEQMLTREET